MGEPIAETGETASSQTTIVFELWLRACNLASSDLDANALPSLRAAESLFAAAMACDGCERLGAAEMIDEAFERLAAAIGKGPAEAARSIPASEVADAKRKAESDIAAGKERDLARWRVEAMDGGLSGSEVVNAARGLLESQLPSDALPALKACEAYFANAMAVVSIYKSGEAAGLIREAIESLSRAAGEDSAEAARSIPDAALSEASAKFDEHMRIYHEQDKQFWDRWARYGAACPGFAELSGTPEQIKSALSVRDCFGWALPEDQRLRSQPEAAWWIANGESLMAEAKRAL